jgi:hypothetical protein
MMMAKLSAPRTDRLYPQVIFLVPTSVGSLVDPRALVHLDGLCQRQIQMTQSGIEPAPFRLVAQCLNQKYQVSVYVLTVELAFVLGNGLR